MKRLLNRYLDLSRSEFNGLLALGWLLIAVVAAPYVWQWLMPEEETGADLREAEKAVHLLEGKIRQGHGSNHWNRRYVSKAVRSFIFDPNKADLKEWQLLGLSEKQAMAIVNYRNKGGLFRKPEDLQKMYTISPEVYRRLLPYVRIGKVAEPSSGEFIFKPRDKGEAMRKTFPVIEINSADSAMLCMVKGIGPVFANRIIRYRERLGGFCRSTQLMEVFGLDSLKYLEISKQISVDSVAIRQININTATFEMLRSHPYLRYKQINALLQFRKQHGNYRNIADLSGVLLLNPADIARLAPYLTF